MNRVISADSHVQEPPELYERIPKSLRHRAPRIVERDGGALPRRRRATSAAARHRRFAHPPMTIAIASSATTRAGGRDIDRRLTDLERDGVSAEVIYPNQSLGLFMSPAPDYQLAVAKAWNDWASEHFGPHRNRFAPVGDDPGARHRGGGGGSRTRREARLPVDQGAHHEPRTALQPAGVRAAVGGHRGHRHGARVPCVHELRGHLPGGLGRGRGHRRRARLHGHAHGGRPQSGLAAYLGRGVRAAPEARLRGGRVRRGVACVACSTCSTSRWRRSTCGFARASRSSRASTSRARASSPSPTTRSACATSSSPARTRCSGAATIPTDEGSFPYSQEVIARTFEGLSDEDREKIVRGNAARIYGFDA